jgi:ribonuclease HI
MKDVTIYTTASCDWKTRQGSFFVALRYQETFKYLCGHQTNTTADRCILVGLIEALHLLKEPCQLTLITATPLAFDRMGKPQGCNKDLKKLLLRLLDEKQCDFTFDVWHNGGHRLKATLSDIEKKANKVSPTLGDLFAENSD